MMKDSNELLGIVPGWFELWCLQLEKAVDKFQKKSRKQHEFQNGLQMALGALRDKE